MAGWITIGTGATPGTAGILATITYANPLLAAAKIILLTPRNAAAALEVQKVYVDMAGATTTTFDIRVGATALAATASTEWQYLVIL
jgi:GH24 family phage-related lysozyme (muramidase)